MVIKPGFSDAIVEAILDKYARLPRKFKPAVDKTGLSNWVPLAGIAYVVQDDKIEVVAVATGMKCLPVHGAETAYGCVLHDSHAEILAIRAFNRFLLEECLRLVQNPDEQSSIIERSMDSEKPQPFAIRDSVAIHMYCSEAPCGDASMELIMAAQADATPWENSVSVDEDGLATMHGREDFSRLGVVRRKPARGDSPLTLSKSCSDKIAMKQCTSLLSSLACNFIQPSNAYLSSLILPESQLVPGSIDRAFSSEGRLSTVKQASLTWPEGFGFHPFNLMSTDLQFDLSRRSLEGKPNPSNISAVWTPNWQEVMINGVIQGRKVGDERGASAISRRRLADMCKEINQRLGQTTPRTYLELKQSVRSKSRRLVKKAVIDAALQGWRANVPDDFTL